MRTVFPVLRLRSLAGRVAPALLLWAVALALSPEVAAAGPLVNPEELIVTGRTNDYGPDLKFYAAKREGSQLEDIVVVEQMDLSILDRTIRAKTGEVRPAPLDRVAIVLRDAEIDQPNEAAPDDPEKNVRLSVQTYVIEVELEALFRAAAAAAQPPPVEEPDPLHPEELEATQNLPIPGNP